MPILNHRDYKNSRARLAQLELSLTAKSTIGNMAAQLPPDVVEARRQTLKAEFEKIQREIEEYEALLGSAEEPNLDIGADQLGYIPILARIARKLSQRELAELLEIKEQQIQRYENERYSGISLSRYENILDVLGVELHPKLRKTEKQERKSAEEESFSPELLRELQKRKWLDLPPDSTKAQTADHLRHFLDSSLRQASGKLLYRKTAGALLTEGEMALSVWRARIVHLAASQRASIKGRFNLADTTWIKSLVVLSVFPDGPLQAMRLLREKGILLVIEPQLAHSKLDGVALRLNDGIPVIGMTLRHDRVDNFWFTLSHELGHVFLHYNNGLDDGFADDLDIEGTSKAEDEADSFARSILIPDELWASSPARFAKSLEMIVGFASSLNIHPAIVAGRIQKERKNYKLFSDSLGRGHVRNLFFHSVA